MSDDEFVLRDEKGSPLTSIFHEVPINEVIFKASRRGGKTKSLLDLVDLLFPGYTIHDTEIKEDEEE